MTDDPLDHSLRALADPARRDHLQARPDLPGTVLAGVRRRRERDRVMALAVLIVAVVGVLAIALPILDGLAGTVLDTEGQAGGSLAEAIVFIFAAPLALVVIRRRELQPC